MLFEAVKIQVNMELCQQHVAWKPQRVWEDQSNSVGFGIWSWEFVFLILDHTLLWFKTPILDLPREHVLDPGFGSTLKLLGSLDSSWGYEKPLSAWRSQGEFRTSRIWRLNTGTTFEFRPQGNTTIPQSNLSPWEGQQAQAKVEFEFFRLAERIWHQGKRGLKSNLNPFKSGFQTCSWKVTCGA